MQRLQNMYYIPLYLRDLFQWRLQTHPLLQRKVYGVCQVLRKYNDNWLFGPILELREAVLITIEITFTMRRCAEHPDPAALGHCHEALQISVFQADDIVADRFNYSSRYELVPLFTKTLGMKSVRK
ncbi:hypothetical protein FGIG_05333 [Fasciola gigantica]|uniref:Eph LBD domain-containing protein n=1 Tax=Fasciola gigantica TaxID=46835 RepID=A0A504YJ44_FASGI|nr:hypothetical protein FGIG_05333 [Fasciola gigantica]